MYTVPRYVTYRTEEDAIYITSELYRNTVRLTDHGLQKEFINLTRCGGCAELNTPLTRYLHKRRAINRSYLHGLEVNLLFAKTLCWKCPTLCKICRNSMAFTMLPI